MRLTFLKTRTGMVPNLPPVKTKPESKLKENQTEAYADSTTAAATELLPVSQATGYSGNPNNPNPGLQFYYYPTQIQPPVQPVQMRPQYMPPQQYQPLPGQIPVGYQNPIPGMGPVYGGGPRPVAGMEQYDVTGRAVSSDGMNQQVYYGVRNGGVVAAAAGGYNPAAMVVPSAEERRSRSSECVLTMQVVAVV